ncbi:MAG: helix-hairpin-helix domain-containing protein [Oliverpabstia sp.]
MKRLFLLSVLFVGAVFCFGCGGAGSVLKDMDTAAEEVQESESVQEEADSDAVEAIFVDVCGAVQQPGVYELPAGSRIFQAIALAGGLTEEAESRLINQAEVLTDGQQIRIYTREESEKQEIAAVAGQNADVQGTTEAKINLNRADKNVLMTLQGIGEAKAEAILAYRQEKGGFSSVEELMQVEGIKDKLYEKLKDKVTVQ